MCPARLQVAGGARGTDVLGRVLGAWLWTRAVRAGGRLVIAIDGSGLLSLCHQHDIPARILNRSQPRKRSE